MSRIPPKYSAVAHQDGWTVEQSAPGIATVRLPFKGTEAEAIAAAEQMHGMADLRHDWTGPEAVHSWLIAGRR